MGPSIVPKYSATALALWGSENKWGGPAYSGFHVIRTLFLLHINYRKLRYLMQRIEKIQRDIRRPMWLPFGGNPNRPNILNIIWERLTSSRSWFQSSIPPSPTSSVKAQLTLVYRHLICTDIRRLQSRCRNLILWNTSADPPFLLSKIHTDQYFIGLLHVPQLRIFVSPPGYQTYRQDPCDGRTDRRTDRQTELR